jgi:hypothetical protein
VCGVLCVHVAGGGVSISIKGICYNASMIMQGCAFVDNVAPGDVIIAEIDYLHRLVLALEHFVLSAWLHVCIRLKLSNL